MKSLIEWLHEKQVKRAERILGLTRGPNTYGVSKAEVSEVLYDFFKNYDGSTPIQIINSGDQSHANGNGIPTNKIEEEKKINVRPKDVFDELERVPNPIDLDPESISKKIELLERKIKLGDIQFYTEQQMRGMIVRLKNRVHYNEHKEFYEQYQYTTQEKIDELLEKYHLCIKKSTLFVPTFPDDAIDAMESYTKETKKFTNRPEYYVIAKEDDFKKKERKLDPILLVQSPFGFYWQILGAWDEEMLLLDEL